MESRKDLKYKILFIYCKTLAPISTVACAQVGNQNIRPPQGVINAKREE